MQRHRASTKGGVRHVYVSLCLCRAEATQEEILNLPGDNDLSPKVCAQLRRPLGRAQGSGAVDSQAGRVGGGKEGGDGRNEGKRTGVE